MREEYQAGNGFRSSSVIVAILDGAVGVVVFLLDLQALALLVCWCLRSLELAFVPASGVDDGPRATPAGGYTRGVRMHGDVGQRL